MGKSVMALFVVLLCFLINPHAYALNWTDIQINNPDAETGDMTGWHYTGSMGADQYEPQTMQPIYPHTGKWFFSAAQPVGDVATMTQRVDVSSLSSSVDRGLVLYDFGFYYQNEYWDRAWDTGEGKISFYNSAVQELKSYSTGEMANDVWTLANYQDYIPSDTRSIELKFIGRRYSGSSINAFFDDAHLKVGVAPEPSSLSLFLLGSGSLGIIFFKRKKYRPANLFKK